jgi:RimJ/RimL family protein N-acetyltransferase
MLELSPARAATLADWFQPERPGPLVGAHRLATGCGQAWADRWPAPRALLVDVAGNYSLAGDPAALQPADLPPLAGFVEAPAPFVPLLRAAFPDMIDWERIIYALPASAALAPRPAPVRRLGPADAAHLAGLSDEAEWVSKTWGGPAGLAASGYAWGAFVDGRLASVASPFFLGRQYEDIGVATEPGFRRRGLSAACAAALVADIRARGHTPSWSTSVDNPASQRVAETLGFVFHRRDWLYVIGMAENDAASG